ncbi:MAG: glutamine--fructose-6-phosphate transaminase (isomerizing) [Clostridia bacterium]|nr:glutamine--fructose-6-phosphate transaminase (isomerizing) [Clostridia bacterium]
MCGIFGYTGIGNAREILMEGLSRLTYRGYDSAGIALKQGSEKTTVVKEKGKFEALCVRVATCKPCGDTGIGHTRWATHGAPTVANAHPHVSMDGMIALVHNGIIENDRALRAFLAEQGVSLISETDTEAVACLIAYHYALCRDPVEALCRSMAMLKGSYALAVIFEDRAHTLYAVRRESPLIVGVARDACFVASDVPALRPYTDRVFYMENDEIARLTETGVTFFDRKGNVTEKAETAIPWDADGAEKGDYEHFMLKEICETPRAVQDTLGAFLTNGCPDFSAAGLDEERLREIGALRIVACGSAYHAGLAAVRAMETLAQIPVMVEYASEYRSKETLTMAGEHVLVISQSGETADTLAALRTAKARGVRTLAVVNVVGSSVAREADHVLYTRAGPEIAVATTKAYSAQVALLYLLAVSLGRAKGTFCDARYEALIASLLSLPDAIGTLVLQREPMRALAERLSCASHMFLIGRGGDLAACMEGALKIKEISYIHAEAYPAGELKHGTLSLVETGTPVLAVLTDPRTCGKTTMNLREARSRGAFTVAFCMGDGADVGADALIPLPVTEPLFAVSLAVIPLQLLAYDLTVLRGYDVDRPRNLAKSVTVE